MKLRTALVNQYGESWTVEHRESERLTNLGGFLVTYADLSCIIVSTRLPLEAKDRGREVLLDRLMTLPVGTSGMSLWHPDDETSTPDSQS